MNPQLIPRPDILGLPTPPWMVLVLMAATLAAHWLFIGSAVGGATMVLLYSLRAGADEAAARIKRTILLVLPFLLSMGVTLGIAPLLFVQVLYGNFFYTANVLVAGWWLLIVPLVIGNLYLFYILRARLSGSAMPGPARPLAAAAPWIIVAIFLLLALVLSSNAQLSQSPADWTGAWAFHGAALHLGGVALWRWAFALLGFLTVGGMFVALLAKAGWMHDEPAAARAFAAGVGLALTASVLQVFAGAGLLVALGADLRGALSGSGVGLGAAVAGAALAALTILLLARAAAARSGPALIGGLSCYFLALVAVALVRDALRQAAIRPWFELSTVPVHPQWGPLAMFAGFLVVGIGAVVAIIRLARSGPAPQK